MKLYNDKLVARAVAMVIHEIYVDNDTAVALITKYRKVRAAIEADYQKK